MEQKINSEVERRCYRVLDIAFRGIHHVDGWARRKSWGDGVALSTFQDLSTFDADILTRLVVAAHDECVRVSVAPSGPGMVKIILHPRTHGPGAFYERHDTMEQAMEKVRAWCVDRGPGGREEKVVNG